MRVLAVACALVACAPSTFLVAEAAGLRKNSHSKSQQFKDPTSLSCTLGVLFKVQAPEETMEDDDISFECKLDPSDANGLSGINVPLKLDDQQKNDLKKRFLETGELISGHSKLIFDKGIKISNKYIHVPSGQHLSINNDNVNGRRTQATDDGTPKYQRFPYNWPNCPEGFDITTQEECSEAIAALGITNGGMPWIGSRTTMPRFCSLQKSTDSMIFNTNPSGDRKRWDLAPVCKWTGKEAPPDFFRASREEVTEWRGVEHTITVKPEEWDYFLAFQESRKNGFSCPCDPGVGCNEIEAPGKHWHPPNPERATFDCKLWTAAWLHAEDQCIQGYFSHNSRDGFSPRMRCEAVDAVYRGEHQAGRHTTGLGALRGLQSSPGHCNSMFKPSFRGFAAAHGARRNDPRGDGDVWTVLYNGGGSDISDSESCIPPGYTATGERLPPTPTTPSPTTPTPGPPSSKGPTAAPTRSATGTNVARGKPTSQSTTGHGGSASRGVDGNSNGQWSAGSTTHTINNRPNPWWKVDLEESYEINKITVYNREDCCSERLASFKVAIFHGASEAWSYIHDGTPGYKTDITVPASIIGDMVEVSLAGNSRTLSLAEVEVYGVKLQ